MSLNADSTGSAPFWILENPTGTWKIESVDKNDASPSTSVNGKRDYAIVQIASISYTLEGTL